MNTMEEITINDRIEQIIHHYKLSKSSFSKKIGVKSSTTINNIVSGRKSKPGYAILRKIAECFPVNTDWLLLGKGPMLRDTEGDVQSDDTEVDRVANAIVRFPEKYERHPVFAKYLENERNKAIVAHYVNLTKSGNIAIAPESFKVGDQD